jgi:cation diffusion facilitator CzcD-associated flavoprotein CzcO
MPVTATVPHMTPVTAKRMNGCEVAVVGAGPYGLSIAAHLRHAGLSTRAFGEPMSFWRDHMPKGMRLRSPWQASHISDPAGALSLDAFASEHDAKRANQLPLDDFVAYGDWFQQRAVPDVDRRSVRRVEADEKGFRLALADGEIISADRVVVATGLANQDYRPPAFRGLPSALVSHACEHADFAPMRGRHVAVIGRGQSACESAALLAEAGAEVELICRGEVRWLGATNGEAQMRSVALGLRELLAAPSAVGPFPLSWLVEFPAIARRMPSALRDWFSKRCLKAGAAGWLKPRFDTVKISEKRAVIGARAVAGRITLDLDDGPRSFDHVVLGTGYRIDVSRLGFLSPQLLDTIARVHGSPLLRAGFESSVPKLHFAGSYAVNSFGPLMRFVAGAPFTARAITNAALGRRAPRASDELSGALAPNLSPRQ